MNGESSEGVASIDAADAPKAVSGEVTMGETPKPPAQPADGEAPRPPRAVPRPTPSSSTLAAADDAALTVRRPEPPKAAEDPVATLADDGPPEINRFLSPPPPPLTESPSNPGDTGSPRRRSRRTVKIPDDAVPQKSAPPVEIVAAQTIDPPAEKAVATPVAVADPPKARPLPVIPPSPPVPTLTPRSAVEVAGPPPVEMFERIQPMRIINIGSQPPPELPPPVAEPARVEAAPTADDRARNVTRRRPSRPPLAAMPEIEHFEAAPAIAAPKPKPPAVEEVEAIADDEPEAIAAPTLRTEEIESIPDDDIEPDRISDVSTETAATTDEIPVDVVEAPPPTKKPPPPPPKRTSSLEMPAVSAESAKPPSTPVPSAPVAPARPIEAAPPPPPPAAAPERPLAQTVDITGSRKRQKPWWEEIFSDDYLRTMEKIEPKTTRKECDFIEDRLGLEKGAIMLDLACGAGTHAVELSSRGYNVVGYDLSLAMLARAQDEALDRGQRINLLQGDIREMAFEEAFDGIYCWNTSFGYFEDEKNLDVLARIRRGLRQGGMFLLDVANRDYVCPRQPSLVWFEGDGCVCMDEMFVDFFTSRLRVKRTVMFEDGRAKECDYGIRLYGLHELGKMLHETGFKVVEVTGHPAHPGVFFGSESPRIIILAERA